ncbi:MAG: hypothetical protein QW784_05895 [Acidilobaceae archaeon]
MHRLKIEASVEKISEKLYRLNARDYMCSYPQIFILKGSREDLKNKVDWIGANYYSRVIVKPGPTPVGFNIVEGYG